MDVVLNLNGAVGSRSDQLSVRRVQLHAGEPFLSMSMENAKTHPPGLNVPQAH